MGKRGPQPKPTALKLVKGERKDRINTKSPVPDADAIVAPSWMGDEAKKVWAEYAPRLERKDVLTAWDCESFAGWCDAVARRQHAAHRLNIEGEVIEAQVFDRNGQPTGVRIVQNQWMFVWKSANEVVQRVGARFGLTPSERNALSIGGAEKGDTRERFLS